MSYLPRNNARQGRSRKIFILLGVFLAGTLVFSLLGGVAVSLISPLWRSENALGASLRWLGENLHSRSSLVSENILLKDRVASLEREAAAAGLRREQEASLAALLGRAPRAGEVFASVLTRPPQSPYDLFVIDAGEKDGIALGSRVALPEGPALGIISDIFSSSAKVRLYTSAGERTEAVLERGNIPVLLEGRGAGNFRLEIPREIVVMPGDRILSADTSFSLIGVVEEVLVEPTDAFKEILAKSPANIFSVRIVSISP